MNYLIHSHDICIGGAIGEPLVPLILTRPALSKGSRCHCMFRKIVIGDEFRVSDMTT